MKANVELNRLRSQVLSNCFNKFTANPITDEFINFAYDALKKTKQNPEAIETFKKNLTSLVQDFNLAQFIEYLSFLDQEQLMQMARIEGTGLDSSGLQQARLAEVVQPSSLEAESVPEYDLYDNLVFVFTLPKAFKDLSQEQKDRIGKLNSDLVGQQARTLNNREYSSINQQLKHKLFEAIRNDLFPEETDIGTISRFFFTRLGEKLEQKKVENSLIGLISGEAVNFLSDLNKQIKAEPKIKAMMVRGGIAKFEDDLEVSKNEVKSASNTYIVVNRENSKKYYAKTFDTTVSFNGKLNPNELFIYKVMEYTGYGPKTNFLVEPGSSSAGQSSIFKGNFILTEDVCGPSQEFFLDVEDNKDTLTEFAQHDRKKFAIEISSAAALTDILSIADVFGQNAKNYGVVGNPNNLKDYRLQFIDHQPNPGNGLFSTFREEEKLAYSPRESLPRKYINKLTPLTELALESRVGEFAKRAIQEEVHEKLFCQQDDQSTLLESAIRRAKEDVMSLVEKANINFVDNAVADHLDKYIEKIHGNIETYKKSIGKTSQAEIGATK